MAINAMKIKKAGKWESEELVLRFQIRWEDQEDQEGKEQKEEITLIPGGSQLSPCSYGIRNV